MYKHTDTRLMLEGYITL